ncbi:MAG: flagellar biosynthesis anti-sigma factor FlgM [Erythrobacter sp.]|nr:flagellar biosynthesis anti-sigma factor FlgM [Erythrobacter sp.]
MATNDRTELEQRAAAGGGKAAGEAAARSGVSLEIGAGLNASEPPVDTDRVEKIREALRDGTYPLVPTKIADAIIAARVSFTIDI